MTSQIEITKDIAANVLKVVDAGLSNGVGNPKPGEMCVEAAVCYALGLPHGDDPGCVAPALRSLKIRLNDSNWSSKAARAKGLRRLAVAQLGSKDHLDEKEFRKRVVDYALRVSVPQALRSAASIQKDMKHKLALCEAANRCEKEGTGEAARQAKEIAYAASAYAYDSAASADAYAASASAHDAAASASASASADAHDAAASAFASASAADAADAAAAAKELARDKSLANYAEAVVQILIEMKAPGCQWLELTEIAAQR